MKQILVLCVLFMMSSSVMAQGIVSLLGRVNAEVKSTIRKLIGETAV